jgi:hypothetical protein
VQAERMIGRDHPRDRLPGSGLIRIGDRILHLHLRQNIFQQRAIDGLLSSPIELANPLQGQEMLNQGWR